MDFELLINCGCILSPERIRRWQKAVNRRDKPDLARNLLNGLASLQKIFGFEGWGREKGNAIPRSSPTGRAMLAIPVLRSRVAPVLNWCSRIQIFPEDPSLEAVGRELILPHLEAAQRLKVLRDEGVSTLICGALSVDLLGYARDLGLTVVSGVAGEVREVVRSYWQNALDHPKFRLPGCRGARRYRSGWRGGSGTPCNGQGRAGARGSRSSRSDETQAMGLGPGGICRCPACGFQIPHEQGIPCIQVQCPRCGRTLERT